jgi:hypothetical protein
VPGLVTVRTMLVDRDDDASTDRRLKRSETRDIPPGPASPTESQCFPPTFVVLLTRNRTLTYHDHKCLQNNFQLWSWRYGVEARVPARLLVPLSTGRADDARAALAVGVTSGAQNAQPIASSGLLRSAEEMIAEVRRRAHDPSVFDDTRTPFPGGAEISSDRIDAYFTFMDESTLRNFADDAEAGISFQNSHVARQIGFGRSIGGRYVDDEAVKRTVAESYTVPGVRLNDVSTDDFIIGVRSSLISDVSVGFHGGMWRCTICRRDI